MHKAICIEQMNSVCRVSVVYPQYIEKYTDCEKSSLSTDICMLDNVGVPTQSQKWYKSLVCLQPAYK